MSQRSRSQKSQRSLSQASQENVANTEETAHNVVRYIILRGGEHMRFSQSELRRNVISKFGGKPEEIIAKVRVILKKVYGYNIMVCDATKGKENTILLAMLCLTSMIPWRTLMKRRKIFPKC
ncbi:hypothetical protein HUJ04_008095 [Dendroctonus ponderosae]|uniref:MAGE domain-containing protein n=1 Tax=Dendroctonus ponderosae TaxID=77166 RepID=A0AAR5PH80_DENPD|nr:hypothetical protein HUJ04_008095 [Dendroctonus ponderosae]KAH0999693.1 hypothetical protein HUJ04_008095 [Dendroctonus ponderosae]KAH0999694.1 hypothetical protein HUJ04_008095 [Dendroctonus ponderosae]